MDEQDPLTIKQLQAAWLKPMGRLKHRIEVMMEVEVAAIQAEYLLRLAPCEARRPLLLAPVYVC